MGRRDRWRPGVQFPAIAMGAAAACYLIGLRSRQSVLPRANLAPVKIPAYSSLAAFLAHYHALRSATSRSSDEETLLIEFNAVLAALAPEARAALDSHDNSGGSRRHRERAELGLSRGLAARGIVAG